MPYGLVNRFKVSVVLDVCVRVCVCSCGRLTDPVRLEAQRSFEKKQRNKNTLFFVWSHRAKFDQLIVINVQHDFFFFLIKFCFIYSG